MSLVALSVRAASRSGFESVTPPEPDPPRDGGYESLPPAAASPAPASPAPPAAAASALEKLVTFIPTETIALFWLCVPAAKSVAKAVGMPADGWTWIDVGVVVFLMLVVTPAILILTFLNRLTTALPGAPRPRWPWWEVAAAAVAFFFWTFAVPGNPFIGDKPELLMGAWVLAAIVSGFLSQIDPIVKAVRDRPPPAVG